jgi:hypothetical protein
MFSARYELDRGWFMISIEKRFWGKVDIKPCYECCWPWLGCRDGLGYGMFTMTRRSVRAHRVAFLLERGRLPEPCGLHLCDWVRCCNPAHIFEGSRDDNNKDRAAKGRSAVGDASGRAKLTSADVLAIRDAVTAGEACKSVAVKFGVSLSQIYSIAHRRSWSHL